MVVLIKSDFGEISSGGFVYLAKTRLSLGRRAVCKTECKSFQIPWVNSVQKFPPGVMRSSGRWAGESGVLVMDTIAKVRFRRSVGKESISSIARELNLSRPTVRKHCRTQTEPIYRRAQQPTPMLGA